MPEIIRDEFDPAEATADEHQTHRTQQRAKLVGSLDSIAAEVTTALKDAGLMIPVFLTVPSSGESLMTFATPLDPTDEDWAKVREIIVPIVQTKISTTGLYSRQAPCISAGVPMGAADTLNAPSGPVNSIS